MTQDYNEVRKLEETVTGIRSTGPGQRLRQVRETRNIGLEEVAKNLRLSPQRVALIEADEYEAMGASAFVRGYLRAYARFLNIPEEEILNSFGESGLASEIRSNKPRLIHEKMVQHVRPSVIRRIIYLIFLAVLVAGGFWWHNHVNGDKSATEDKGVSSSISELNQQGVSQVAVDPQSSADTVENKDVVQQPLPTQVLNSASANSASNNANASGTSGNSDAQTTEANSTETSPSPRRRMRGGVN